MKSKPVRQPRKSGRSLASEDTSLKVLLLSDDHRLENIFVSCTALPNFSLHVARNLEEGFATVEAKPPSYLFIQSGLSGFSGDIIVRHAREILLSSGPDTTITLLAATTPSGSTVHSTADHTIPLSLPTNEIAAAIAAILAGGPALPIKNPAENASPPPKSRARSGEHSVTRKTIQPVPQQQITLAPEKTFTIPEPVRNHSLYEQTVAPSEANFQETLKTFLADKQSPLQSLPPQRSRGPWFYLPIVIALAASLLVLASSLWQGRLQKPAGTLPLPVPTQKNPAPPPTPPTEKRQGFSFLPKQGYRADYGKKHPGWEQYLSPTTEFKLFKDKSSIKALQIIDRSSTGIRPEYLNKVLVEVAGTRTFVTDERTEKEDYLIEKGALPTKARIILYRKKPKRLIKAVVIYFP